jgi:hypothetical protein
MHFKIIGKVDGIERIAAGKSIRDFAQLRKQYGAGRWRKLKGVVTVLLSDATIRKAKIHWYEAHGIGRTRVVARLLIICNSLTQLDTWVNSRVRLINTP